MPLLFACSKIRLSRDIPYLINLFPVRLIVPPIVGSMFFYTLLYVHFSIAIILMGKRELVALLLSSWCLVKFERLFLTVLRCCLRFVIMLFPDHTHLLSLQSFIFDFREQNNCMTSELDDNLTLPSMTDYNVVAVDTHPDDQCRNIEGHGSFLCRVG